MTGEPSTIDEQPGRLRGSRLARLMRPSSVAIVGASDRPGALGASVLQNLLRQGFAGDIHLVNHKRSDIAGRPCVQRIADLPLGIDAAVLAIPRESVLDSVRALAERQVGAVVIFSAGFAEAGAQGIAEQREIASIAAHAGMVVEGPNCLGLVNFLDGVALSFIEMPDARVKGDRRVGIVSQSGAMAAVLATTMIDRGVPLASYVSTGNEAADGVEDFVEYLIDEPGTDVIALIVEQFRQPQRFLTAARAARAAGKRIILLHPGRSEAARASAATHTGAMAGDYSVMLVHVQHAGVIVAQTLEELGDLTEIALRCAHLPHGATGVIVESGAFKAMTLDLCSEIGVRLAPLSDDDSPDLRAAVPPFVSVSNPLDITAQGLVDPALYERTLAALVADQRIDTVVVALIQTLASTSRVKLAAITNVLKAMATTKPVLVAGVDEGGGIDSQDIEALRALGVPYLPTSERLFRALRSLTSLPQRRSSEPVDNRSGVTVLPVSGTVPEFRAKSLLAPLGFPFPSSELVQNLEEATAAAGRIGYPVVLKAQSAELSHKSDAGGVIVGLKDPEALAAAWRQLEGNVNSAKPGLVLDGVLIENMADPGLELIIGARQDAEWGPVVLVGLGGVAAELFHDIRLLPTDLTSDEILGELRQLKMAALLDGYRGSPPVDVDAVAEIVRKLSALLLAAPAIREVDFNPVIAFPRGRGALILDALITTA